MVIVDRNERNEIGYIIGYQTDIAIIILLDNLKIQRVRCFQIPRR